MLEQIPPAQAHLPIRGQWNFGIHSLPQIQAPRIIPLRLIFGKQNWTTGNLDDGWNSLEDEMAQFIGGD